MELHTIPERPTVPARFTLGNIAQFIGAGALLGFLMLVLTVLFRLVVLDYDGEWAELSWPAVGLIACIGFIASFIIIFVFGRDTVVTNNFMVDEQVDVRRIGDCQYLGFKTYYGYRTYTHKGDCDNPIHQHRK